MKTWGIYMRNATILLLVLMCLMLCSCISLPVENQKEMQRQVPPAEIDQSLRTTYSFKFSYAFNGEIKNLKSSREYLYRDEFEDALLASRVFNAAYSQGTEEMHIEAELVNSVNPTNRAIAQAVGIFSLTLIPCWVTDHYHLKARVVAPDGSQKHYNLQASQRTYVWLPFMLLGTVFDPWEAGHEVRMNIYKRFITNICKDLLLG